MLPGRWRRGRDENQAQNLKKVLSLVLCVAMMLSVMVVGAGAAFSDQSKIKNTEAVDACTALNIIGGYPDGSFKPEGNITRAEVTKMICVALNGGKNPAVSTNTTPTFSDVRNNANAAWAEGYIESCAAQGIVSGVGGGKFAPNGNVTGVQLAKMLLVSLGYKSENEGFTGNAWATNVNVRAAQKGLYAGLEKIDSNAAITRDNAARMVWNALQAYEVEYKTDLVADKNGKLSTQVTVSDKVDGNFKKITLLRDKYDAWTNVGTLVGVKNNEISLYMNDADQATSDLVNKAPNNANIKFTKVSKDYSDLMGQKVKVIFKNGKTNDVIGVYATSDNTTYTVNQADIDTSGAKIDANGTKLSVDSKGVVVYTDGQKTAEGWTAASFKNEKSANVVTLIDTDGDNDIDTACIKTYTVGKVTSVSSSSVIIGGKTYKFDDDNISKDLKKDDWAIITENLYNDNKDIVKADMKTTKVDATKNQGKDPAGYKVEFKLDGTWYTVAATAKNDIKSNAKSGVTVKYVAVNGILFYAEKSSGSDSVSKLTDVALIVAKGTGVDGKRVKLAFFDGTTKTVNVADDVNNAQTDVKKINSNAAAGTDVGYAALVEGGVYEYTVSGDKYNFKTIDTSDDNYGDYTAKSNGFAESVTDESNAVVTNLDVSEQGNQKLAGTKVADNATILLYDKTNDDTKVITGKQYKSANNVTGGTIWFQAKIDGLKQVAAAVVCVRSIDGQYTTNDNYGYIVSDAEDVSGNCVTYDVWTAKGLVTVTEKTNEASTRQARTIIGYSNIKDDSTVASGKLIEDVEVIETSKTHKYGALNFNGTKNAYDQLNTGANVSNKYNITSDTKILYVDTKEKTGSETGSFSDATDYQNVYVPNAFYIIDDKSDGDNKDLALIIYDTANKFYGANEKTLTKKGSEKDLISYVEDSYGDEVTFNASGISKDPIAQGNLITVTLKSDSEKTVNITLTNAKFVDDGTTSKSNIKIAAGTETQVTFVLTGTNNATITVA